MALISRVCGLRTTAAASGPSSIAVWLLALFGFFLPLAACVLEMSSRYPDEGGLYVWAQKAFGDFSGFMAAWTYWMSNLPYFSAILYFAAASLLFTAGDRGKGVRYGKPQIVMAVRAQFHV